MWFSRGSPRQGSLSHGGKRICGAGRGCPVIQVQCLIMHKLILTLLALIVLSSVAVGLEVKRTEDIIYGRKFGTALTMDVFEPEKANGYGIIFMVSGGFFSAKEAINQKMYMPFLERGYSVFAIADMRIF